MFPPRILDRLWQDNGRLSGLPREEWDLKMDFFDEPESNPELEVQKDAD